MNPGSNPGQMQMAPGIAVEKKVPTLVKIISVLYYIGAVFIVIFGILLIAGAGFISSLLSGFNIPVLGAIGSGLFIVAGVVMLLLGILEFFIARGLWKGRNWARIFVIIFSIIGILWAVFGFIQGSFMNSAISLVLSGLIGGYLLFSHGVKEAFSR